MVLVPPPAEMMPPLSSVQVVPAFCAVVVAAPALILMELMVTVPMLAEVLPVIRMFWPAVHEAGVGCEV